MRRYFASSARVHLNPESSEQARQDAPWFSEYYDYFLLKAFPGVWWEDLYLRCPDHWKRRMFALHVEDVKQQNIRYDAMMAKAKARGGAKRGNVGTPGADASDEDAAEWESLDDWSPDAWGQEWTPELAEQARRAARGELPIREIHIENPF